jgi:DNA-directed RNA polymerase subunit omega
MVMLNAGARALVDLKSDDKMAVVIQEILQERIFLDASGNVGIRAGKDAPATPAPDGQLE